MEYLGYLLMVLIAGFLGGGLYHLGNKINGSDKK